MLKQVIWIEKTEFICRLAENILKEKGVSCYTLNNCEDFAYLLKDLKPELLVCDLKTISTQWDQFCAQTENYPGKIIALGSPSDYENSDQARFSGLIAKPLEVETLWKGLSAFA